MENNFPMQYALKEKSNCPKCNLGDGLRLISAIEIGLTGWEHYEFLHCNVCGANFVGRSGAWKYLAVHSPFDEMMED